MKRIPVIAACCLAVVSVRGAGAQKLTVAVSITDSAASRAFSGAFAAALRGLGDVEVVTLAEHPKYVVDGVVLCSPASCDNPLSYSAALRFWSPIEESIFLGVAAVTTNPLPASTFQRRIDSVSKNVVAPLLLGYERTHQTWVVNWSRSRYEQAIREFVREIDTGCFEMVRTIHRALATSDTAKSNVMFRAIREHKWLC